MTCGDEAIHAPPAAPAAGCTHAPTHTHTHTHTERGRGVVAIVIYRRRQPFPTLGRMLLNSLPAWGVWLWTTEAARPASLPS